MNEEGRAWREEHREELRLFCYCMSASLEEAEGLVDAVYHQAGSLPLPLVDTGSTRRELFKLAARLCIATLADQPPRTLPSQNVPPSDPYLPPLEPKAGDLWLEPFPDQLRPKSEHSGERRYTEEESISLHFVAALQSLPPRQRLAAVLADAMGWRVESMAEVLGAGAADTRRILEEARECLSRAHGERPPRGTSPAAKDAIEPALRYLHAWETGDASALAELLDGHAVLQLPPSPSWYQGREAVGRHLSSFPLAGDARGRWRLLPRRANGQPAFGVYRREDEGGRYLAHSLQVVTFEDGLVTQIVAFGHPWLFPAFKLLPELITQTG